MPTATAKIVGCAFIRGINVGGKHSLPMATLRGLCEGLGWSDVATYIQSGNVVFRAPAKVMAGGGTKAAAALEGAIEEECGFRPGVAVRTLAEMCGVVKANPFAGEAAKDPKHLLVMILAGEPTAAARKAVLALKPEPERVVLVGREVYLWYPKGIGQSKFAFTSVEKAVGVAGTCRNWNTIGKVMAMAGAEAIG